MVIQRKKLYYNIYFTERSHLYVIANFFRGRCLPSSITYILLKRTYLDIKIQVFGVTNVSLQACPSQYFVNVLSATIVDIWSFYIRIL